MRLVQISDTHFGTEQPPVVEAAVHAIHALAPDAVVLSGDITQRARPEQFAAARQFVDRLPAGADRIALPGNHDLPLYNVWRRLLAPYADYTRAFGPRESLWRRNGAVLVALDATSPRRHKDGALDDAHVRARLAEARAACGAEGLLLVAVHQPLWTAWGDDRRQTLVRRHAVARAFAEARVDVVLSGHVHVPLIATSRISDPGLPWCYAMSGAGTAVSHRTRPGAPNSFNVLDFAAAAELCIARHDFADGRFARFAEKSFRRTPAGWEEAGPG